MNEFVKQISMNNIYMLYGKWSNGYTVIHQLIKMVTQMVAKWVSDNRASPSLLVFTFPMKTTIWVWYTGIPQFRTPPLMVKSRQCDLLSSAGPCWEGFVCQDSLQSSISRNHTKNGEITFSYSLDVMN